MDSQGCLSHLNFIAKCSASKYSISPAIVLFHVKNINLSYAGSALKAINFGLSLPLGCAAIPLALSLSYEPPTPYAN